MASKQTFRGRGPGGAQKLDENSLWEYALRALSRRANSAGELRQKLARRAQSPEILTAVMEKLRAYGFADDQKFSEAFAAARLQNSGFGKFRVLQDLRSKRVASGTAEQAVEKAFEGTEEKDLIERFLARKYRSVDLKIFLQEDKNMASVYRRLRAAGFASGTSLAALKRHSRRAVDDFDEPPESD